MPGTRLQLIERRGGDDGHRQPVVPTERGITELAAHQRAERVVLTLRVPTGIPVYDVLARFAHHRRALVVRIAHSRCGEFGEPRIQLGTQLRTRDQLAHTHAVGPLSTAPVEPAPQSALLVTEFAVRIEPDGQLVGHLLQLVGPQLGGLLGQEGLSLLHLAERQVLGQVADERLDGAQVLAVEQPRIPRLGRRRQLRRHLLPGERGARLQLGGVPQPPARLGQTDPQHVGDDLVPDAAEFALVAASHRRHHVVGARDGATPGALEAVQGVEHLPRRQGVPVNSADGLHGRVELGERLRYRTHVRIL